MSSPDFQVPKLATLLGQLNKSNQFYRLFVKLEGLCLFLMLIWLPWGELWQHPLPTLVIIAAVFFQSISSYGALIFQNKKDKSGLG